jgi:hypothetical protein
MRSQARTLILAARLILAALLILGAVQAGANSSVQEERYRSRIARAERPTLVDAGAFEELSPADRVPETRADTLSFGYYRIIGEETYAVPGETWTWDHGGADPFEGWVAAIDGATNPAAYFQVITQAQWAADPWNPPVAPILAGQASAWIGRSASEARELCWPGGLGYGNLWHQRLISPELTYDGSGSTGLSFKYFSDTDPGYDFTRVILWTATDSVVLNSPGFTGALGIPPSGPWKLYTRTITNADFGGGTAQRWFRIVLEFESDLGYSDEDGLYPTAYGPFAADDIGLTGNLVGGNRLYDFETGGQEWSAQAVLGLGPLFGIAPVTNYAIQDTCCCDLEGNVAEFHAGTGNGGYHPRGQFTQAATPIIPRADYPQYNTILAEWDQYSDMPMEAGVFYRPGWQYYPWVCPVTQEVGWSPRVGVEGWSYTGGGFPYCQSYRDVATAHGVPAGCEQVRFVFEVASSCEYFGVPPQDCLETNFTPLVDNVRVRLTYVPLAPVIALDPGARFQDGFGQLENLFCPHDLGNADITRNLAGAGAAARLGDSLTVSGPTPTEFTKWEARLWFRLKRMGPRQARNPKFATWQAAVAAQKGDFFTGPNPDFAWGYMDSVEAPTASKRAFCSQFRENDPNYAWGGGPEQSEGNEILPDLAFTPGTKIEYFITSNYICTPSERFVLPDTSGGSYLEFEILPGYRLVGGIEKFPRLLYVNVVGSGTAAYIEPALNQLLNGAGPGASIPDPTMWDRYDHQDPTSNWEASFVRSPGGNAGGAVKQLVGYDMILLDSGSIGPGFSELADWDGLQEWLTTAEGGGNEHLQGLYLTGDDIGETLAQSGSGLLTEIGATLHQGNYRGHTGNTDSCVELVQPGGQSSGRALHGNNVRDYDILGTTNGGQGSLAYRDVDGGPMEQWAQVRRDATGTGSRFRSLAGGFSLSQLISWGIQPPYECLPESASIVQAVKAELDGAIRWCLDISDPLALGLSDPRCLNDVPEESAGPDRLYSPRPNPAQGSAAIRFALSRPGHVRLAIYDVAGREVRALQDAPSLAGEHEVIWNGDDQRSQSVPRGVYWIRLSIDGRSSSKKMLLLR